MVDLRRELDPLASAVQPDVASISEQVDAMAEVVAWGLDCLSDGLVEMKSRPPDATASSMPHGSLAPGRFQTTEDDQPERAMTRSRGD